MQVLTPFLCLEKYFIAGWALVFSIDGYYVCCNVSVGPQVIYMSRADLTFVALTSTARLWLPVNYAVFSHGRWTQACLPELNLQHTRDIFIRIIYFKVICCN